MNKFGRNYELTIETANLGQPLHIKPPFTLEFDITRSTLSKANVAQFRIYNLSLQNRNLIRFNTYEFYRFRAITLRAGYGDFMPIVFKGNISVAWSVREGVNFISQIECYDGGFASVNSSSGFPVNKDTPKRAIIEKLFGDLSNYHVQPGVIGDYSDNVPRGKPISGNTVDILKTVTGGGFFMDNGFANALRVNEYIAAPNTLEINSQTGLLGTPVLEQNIVRFEMIFEPSLNVGTIINLTSTTGSNFNGAYKVTMVKHRGVISDAVAGTAITSGEFLRYGTLKGVKK